MADAGQGGAPNGLLFTKMQALGNDFVVIDATARPLALDGETIRWIADRRLGVGCDQLLAIEPGYGGCDFGYRVFNRDGGEVGHCGNGVRCVARRVRDLGLIERTRIRFAIGSRRIETHLLDDGDVAVDMGVPEFRPHAIPLHAPTRAERYRIALASGEVEVGAVALGNPHALLRVEEVGGAPVATLGPQLERHPDFPERVNVGFMETVALDRIRLRVWERGAGETQACGTGACAAVAIGRRWGLLDRHVVVELPGGELRIDWPGGEESLWMTGPATTVFHGAWPASS